MTDPRIDSYEWRGGREPMLRFGPDDGPMVVLALPLFEEANRTRAFGVSILRALAAHGIGGALPELPGQGESELPTSRMRLADLRAAFAAVPGNHVAAVRSGALLVGQRPCWLLAPQDPEALQRELNRLLGAQERASHPENRRLRRVGLSSTISCHQGDAYEIAGNWIGSDFFDDLATISLPGEGRGGAECRVVRLTTDPREADRHIDSPALWRRAEPDNDVASAQTLATDIADWIASCEG